MTRTITHLLHLESFLALDLYEMPKWMVKFWGGAPPPPQMLWGGVAGQAGHPPTLRPCMQNARMHTMHSLYHVNSRCKLTLFSISCFAYVDEGGREHCGLLGESADCSEKEWIAHAQSPGPKGQGCQYLAIKCAVGAKLGPWPRPRPLGPGRDH